jgi:hypothetical protein
MFSEFSSPEFSELSSTANPVILKLLKNPNIISPVASIILFSSDS